MNSIENRNVLSPTFSWPANDSLRFFNFAKQHVAKPSVKNNILSTLREQFRCQKRICEECDTQEEKVKDLYKECTQSLALSLASIAKAAYASYLKAKNNFKIDSLALPDQLQIQTPSGSDIEKQKIKFLENAISTFQYLRLKSGIRDMEELTKTDPNIRANPALGATKNLIESQRIHEIMKNYYSLQTNFFKKQKSQKILKELEIIEFGGQMNIEEDLNGQKYRCSILAYLSNLDRIKQTGLRELYTVLSDIPFEFNFKTNAALSWKIENIEISYYPANKGFLKKKQDESSSRKHLRQLSLLYFSFNGKQNQGPTLILELEDKTQRSHQINPDTLLYLRSSKVKYSLEVCKENYFVVTIWIQGRDLDLL